MSEESTPKYDLEERLLDYGAGIIHYTRKLTRGQAERRVRSLLLRSGMAPISHLSEAQAAKSPADFIHQMRLALQELREVERWLKLTHRAQTRRENQLLPQLINETDELIHIFVTRITSAKKHRK